MNEIRAVFDCNVFVQSLLNPEGIAAKCLELVKNKRVSLFVSKDSLDEFRDVIFRPNIFSKLPNLTSAQIEAFIDDILSISSILKIVPSIFKFPRDPKDEKYINLAIEANADYVVSRDNDLLDLMTQFSIEAKEFRQRYRSLKIVEPIEFLRIIREQDLSLNP